MMLLTISMVIMMDNLHRYTQRKRIPSCCRSCARSSARNCRADSAKSWFSLRARIIPIEWGPNDWLTS